MVTNREKKYTVFSAVMLSLLISAVMPAQDKITDLDFGKSPVSDSSVLRTMRSVVKVADGLYLMTHHGDCEELFRKENQELMDDPYINDRSRHCSVFSTATGDSVLMGRNWDNENVGSIIVTLYRPPEGYSSISFSSFFE